MDKSTLEKVMSEKVKPKLTELLGVSIPEFQDSISQKLAQSPLLDFNFDVKLKLKDAKKQYRQTYFRRLLRMNYGNISEAAKQAGIDRRSLHRFVKEAGLDVDTIREEMIRPYDMKKEEVAHVLEGGIKKYETVLHPQKISQAYAKIYDVSEKILDLLPEENPTLKEAEDLFEKGFIESVIKDSTTLKEAAKRLGIAYETMLRKKK